MSINLFGPRCACGNRGCFEMYVSNRALLAYYGEAVRGSAATALEKDPAWEEIVAAYLQGDAAASQAVERLNEALAVGITSIINFLNPDTVVLGGTAMRYESQFLDRLREKVLGAAILQYRAGFKLVYARAPQTGDILATGAAQGAYEQCIHRILFPEAFGAVIASS